MKEVQVYSKPSCGACVAAKEFLKSNDVDFVEFNLDEDIEAKKRLLGKGVTTLPFIIIGEKTIDGFNPTEILKALES